MKKLLLVLLAIAVVLAFAGMAVAKGEKAKAKGPICCPPPCKFKNVPCEMIPCPPCKPKPCLIPKENPPCPPMCITDKCGNCITIPGSCYAEWKRPVCVEDTKPVPVWKDLCLGKAKGECKPCGFCVPVKWECKWKTKVQCGTVDVPITKCDWVTYPFRVKCVPEPCPPPDCCF